MKESCLWFSRRQTRPRRGCCHDSRHHRLLERRVICGNFSLLALCQKSFAHRSFLKGWPGKIAQAHWPHRSPCQQSHSFDTSTCKLYGRPLSHRSHLTYCTSHAAACRFQNKALLADTRTDVTQNASFLVETFNLLHLQALHANLTRLRHRQQHRSAARWVLCSSQSRQAHQGHHP